ncbi:MAG: cysteine desulfurase family protein [Anaerobacillus sp.]|uniref:cysteine desulfurase family protein n=1 Tax=Anaerobacillus sp. TaxID=1872506 RepID=UPI00391B6F9A
MLYLDNSATTQMLPEVKEAMLPFLLEEFGNPSSKYYPLASNATDAVAKARKQISLLLGCESDEVIFTSGATESNNMIIKGVAGHYGKENNHLVTSKVEHPSVLETFKYLEKEGFKVTYLEVDKFGRINIDDLKELVSTSPPLFVSIMWGNNELGSLNDIQAASELCHNNNVMFHTDATQVIGKVCVNLEDLPGIRFLSCSAHKFHGPKGIGVSVIRKDSLGLKTKLTPLLHGGGQEQDYRSGTLAVHNIVGMGKAAEILSQNIEFNITRLQNLEGRLISILESKFESIIRFNNDNTNKIPGIISARFQGVNNEILVKNVAPYVSLSTGSACSSAKPSHVLQAIGLQLDEVRETVRFSLSHLINDSELDIFYQL